MFEVFGTGLYNKNSSLCLAGLHSNIISDDGGTAAFFLQKS